MPAILTACPSWAGTRPVLTKTFTLDGVKDFDSAKHFEIQPFDFESFEDMAAILTELEHHPHVAIVRGDPIAPARRARRLIKPCPKNGDQPTIRPRDGGLSWIMIDLDKVPAPDNLMTSDERLRFLRSTLPEPFRDARCYYQWSSSAGTKGWSLLSAHLWFWLDRPIECANLKARTTEKDGDFYNRLDGAPFSPAQLHYIAAPIFLDVVDPLGDDRSGVLPGDRDSVDLQPWIKPYRPRPVFTARTRQILNPGAGFEELLSEIGLPHYHMPILRSIAHYVAVNKDDTRDRDYCLDRIRDAAACAPRDYIDEEYLKRLYDDALLKFAK